jgi:hypothetical protein
MFGSRHRPSKADGSADGKANLLSEAISFAVPFEKYPTLILETSLYLYHQATGFSVNKTI